jgi:hypothetical protein
MRNKVSNLCLSLCKKVGTERIYLSLLLLLVSIIAVLSFASPCTAQSGYEIRSAVVTPEYGYEDFTYSAQVWMSEQAAGELGVIAVTKFSLKLNIYDKGELIHTESSDQRGLSKTSFVFGPYSFKDRFGISETSNASFEFIFYAGGQYAARTDRIKGPIVQPPTMTGIQFEKKPYFFQGIAVSAGFKDMDGLNPRPTCHLEITGPLGTAESRSWTTADVSCQASGKSTYSCTVAEDLSSYRNGGDFTFKLVYNNLKLDPLTYGPYNISLQPYNPALERVTIPKLLDYTNFTIQAYVKDAGAKMVGGTPDGSVASLIISHPQKGEMAYTSTEPVVRGSSLVYEWTSDSSPALFNRSDVQLAKNAPFQAKVVYKNENWDYQAEKSNLSFRVVEEIPKLDIQYPTTVYVRAGESTTQDIIATVAFSKGAGDMNFRLSGPDQYLNLTEKGVPLGGNRYQYRWQVAFDDRHIDNNYTLALSFVHPTLEGGRYAFEDKIIKVVPLSVQFSEGLVAPTTGLWNESYTYSLKIDTTIVPLDVRLQTYDPCSSEWTDKGAKKAMAQSSWINWTLSPFSYECIEMQQEGAKYRFKASFAGNDYISKPYQGPTFEGSKPVLVSLDSDPVVYVSEGSESAGNIQAVVEYASGQGQAVLKLTGPEKNIEEISQGIALGGNRYRYDWSLPFEETDIGKSFNYTISYKHTSLTEEMRLAEKSIDVKAISINFADATVAPGKGKWNETYAYSVAVKSSVDMKVALEVYNPCSREWVERASRTAMSGESFVNFSAQPFKYKCAEAEGKNASYRFVARFGEETFKSDVYSGPFIRGVKTDEAESKSNGFGTPIVLEPTLNLRFDPIVFIPPMPNGKALQHFNATVIFPDANGTLMLNVSGKNMQFHETLPPLSINGNKSVFKKDVQFDSTHAGNTYEISVQYINSRLPGGEYRFTDDYMRVMQENASGVQPKFNPDVIGNVSPRRGILQAWQEADKLYAFTYTAHFDNLSIEEKPWVELSVKAPGRAWKLVGEKQQFDPDQGNLSWTVKPFYDTEFLGTAQFKFLIDGTESQIFEGPEIVAIYKDLNFQDSAIRGKYNYFGTINGSINLTVDLLGSGDAVSWKNIGKPQKYTAGSGEVPIQWKDQPVLRYYEFDFKTDNGEAIG